MAELGVQPPTGLYPQPPAPPSQGALSDPTKLIELMSSVTRNQQLQQDLKAKTAIGEAALAATGPEGFNSGQFYTGLAANPNAGYHALDAIQQAQSIQTTQLNRTLAEDEAVRTRYGALPRDANDEQLRHVSGDLVRAGVSPLRSEAIRDRLMKLRGEARRRAIDELQLGTIPPGQATGLVQAPPREGELTPQMQTLKERLAPSGGGGGGAGVGGRAVPGARIGGAGGTPQAVAPPPGASEAQTAEATEGQRAATELQNAAIAVPNQRAQLALMRQDLETARTKFGPTAGYEKYANQIVDRVLGFNPTMSKQEISALESFDKVGRQMALSQAANAHATDLTTSTALGANPNTNLSALGNEGILNMIEGNADWTAVKAAEWNDARRGMGPDRKAWAASEHYQWNNKFNKESDPRVFQFMRMNDEQRAALLKSIPDKTAFEKHLLDADKRGWITLPTGQAPANSTKTQQRAPRPDKRSQAEPPIPGARLAADGSWYVRQPHANGDYQRVVMTG